MGFSLDIKAAHKKGYAYVKKNMAFSDLRCKISYIFTEWPLSGPLSRPRGGQDLVAGC